MSGIAQCARVLGTALALLAAPAHAGGEMSIAGPQGPLRGAVDGPGTCGAPAMVIIPGSGATNRDGDVPATYRLLAEGLAASGITTVRVDKRGMFTSAAAVGNANRVTISDYASDARHWVDAIRERTGVPCVWILGHSEGGLVALKAASDASAAGICGVVLVSTAGRRFSDVLREQYHEHLPPGQAVDDSMTVISALEGGEHVDVANMTAPVPSDFRPAVQDYVIDVMSYDPQALMATVTAPALIVQGTRDLQVKVADARLLKGAGPRASLLIVPDANHPLKAVHDRAENLASYRRSDLPLAPGIVDGIAGFVKSNTSKPTQACQTSAP